MAPSPVDGGMNVAPVAVGGGMNAASGPINGGMNPWSCGWRNEHGSRSH